MSRPRVAFVTFGCRVNQSETGMMRELVSDSYEVVGDGADIYVVNGCSVTKLAVKKARQAVHSIRANSPNALVLLVGCLADATSRGLEDFEAIDAAAGNAWKSRLPEVLARVLGGERGQLEAAPSRSLDEEPSAGPADRARAILKVEDGCSGACSYCHAVQLRGRPRSKSVRRAADEAARLVTAGYPELVLAGINLAEYRAPDGSLADLLRRLLEDPRLRRLRLASLNVAGVSDEFLDVFASDPRLCAHLHIPLESGDDDVLRAMRRPYTSSEYRTAVARVRARLPGVTLGTDVIVGFPGESEAAFAATCRLVEEVGFSNVHIFRFSARSGTEAAELRPTVPESVKRERADTLARISRGIRRRLLDDRVGRIEDVLTEGQQDGLYVGHSDGNFDVAFTSEEKIALRTLCCVRIAEATEDGLRGVHDSQHRTD